MPSPEPSRPDVDIAFPPQPEFVGVARHVIAALVRLSDPGSDIVEDVKLAVSEACTNAVTVTTRAGSEEPVTVVGAVDGGRVEVTVADRGVPREEAGGDAIPESLDFSFEQGLSLPLLEGLVDELEISPRDGGGSVVRMVLSPRTDA
ncbi:MAG: ATP-binding protein [Actinobacteria bacterium]|nr:ATP-binding protein [Actinomycetota bacterium]